MRDASAALVLAMGALLASQRVVAHEIRPAYLEIRLDAAQSVRILWKQPVAGEMALPLRPKLSSGWTDTDPPRSIVTDSFLIRDWTVVAPHAPLEGQRLWVDGLDKTLTDVLIRIVQTNGDETTHILRPGENSYAISLPAKSAPPILEYLTLGIEHIWNGIDHLLFVLGLMLLAPRFRALLQTITAFTLAHSITLAAAALNVIKVPPAPVEAVIALSILYLATELVHVAEGRPALGQRYPWLVAFAFGLLHGLGFAGALSEVGLPANRIPVALLLFNCGIEIGQIVFVSAVLVVLALLARVLPPLACASRRALPHVIGSLAAFWFIERTLVALGVS